MSAPFKMNADQLRELADALDDLTAVRVKHGVSITAYGATSIAIGAATLEVDWDSENEQYIVDDRIGS